MQNQLVHRKFKLFLKESATMKTKLARTNVANEVTKIFGKNSRRCSNDCASAKSTRQLGEGSVGGGAACGSSINARRTEKSRKLQAGKRPQY